MVIRLAASLVSQVENYII